MHTHEHTRVLGTGWVSPPKSTREAVVEEVFRSGVPSPCDGTGALTRRDRTDDGSPRTLPLEWLLLRPPRPPTLSSEPGRGRV